MLLSSSGSPPWQEFSASSALGFVNPYLSYVGRMCMRQGCTPGMLIWPLLQAVTRHGRAMQWLRSRSDKLNPTVKFVDPAFVCASVAMAATCDGLSSLNFLAAHAVIACTEIWLGRSVHAPSRGCAHRRQATPRRTLHPQYIPPSPPLTQPRGKSHAPTRISGLKLQCLGLRLQWQIGRRRQWWVVRGRSTYGGMAQMLSRGYTRPPQLIRATKAAGERLASGHREKLIDSPAHRPKHELTLKAKAIIAAFYGNAAQRSYWFGCRQAANRV